MRELICGIDEAGRGPLAGPVVAAAVVLDPQRPIAGLRDSKKLTATKREKISAQIQHSALAWSIAEASVGEIDSLNILQATMLAMQRAFATLSITPDTVLVDGNRCPELLKPARAIVGGDLKEPSISAASILAKTARDQLMQQLHQLYPQYDFACHKGYPTRRHLELLKRYGASPEHRHSFAPVSAMQLQLTI